VSSIIHPKRWISSDELELTSDHIPTCLTTKELPKYPKSEHEQSYSYSLQCVPYVLSTTGACRIASNLDGRKSSCLKHANSPHE
jgi:hypothetical protein